jgi:hypothetical protein
VIFPEAAVSSNNNKNDRAPGSKKWKINHEHQYPPHQQHRCISAYNTYAVLEQRDCGGDQQLENQDPEQPTDGTAFVTELAQFTTLQEDTTSATDLNTIVAALPSAPPTTPTTPAARTGTTAISNQ